MNPTRKQLERRVRIREAAAKLLLENGYRATSMLQVARAASASNETLYRWYGNKQELFAELVSANAAEVARQLASAVAEGEDTVSALGRVGPTLLGTVTGALAVSLNRAAVTDVHETARLGKLLAACGRDAVMPALARLMAAGTAAGHLAQDSPEHLAEIYVRLLIGDLQIRLAIGAVDAIEPEALRLRAEEALGYFLRLFAPAPLGARSSNRAGRGK
ncbi:MAG: TetR/AcrR family transcriptional regulator [Betaproteobacteria bacterium]|nr:TetR/AcrR family transcriptional regulator [Betaproteobacteria bacterium]